ncbi:MAG: hypothetical protein ACKO5K_17270, partial [Armatimonadota bacterium]
RFFREWSSTMKAVSSLALALIAVSAGNAALPPLAPGTEARYAVRYAASGKVDVAGALFRAKSDPHRVATRLSGTLSVTAVGDGVHLLRFAESTLDRSSDGRPLPSPGEGAELSAPVAVRLDAAGRVRAIGFSPEVSVPVRSLWRTLVADLQVVRPAGAGSSWTADQATSARSVRATYRVGGGGVVVRTDRDAPTVRAIGPKGDPEIKRTFQGGRRFTFAGTALVAVGGTVHTRSTVADRPLATESETFIAKRVAVRSLGVAERSEVARLAAGPMTFAGALSDKDRDPAATLRAWKQALGPTTSVELMAQLDRVDAGSARADGGLFTALCAWIVVEPRAAEDLAVRLGRGAGDGAGFRAVVAAFASVAGDADAVPEAAARAEAALLGVLSRRSGEPEVVATIAPALAAGTRPSAAAWEKLEALAGSADPSIASPARLAIGGIARACPPDVRRRLVGGLCARLDQARGDDIGVLLAALGNAGSADALPWLIRHAVPGAPYQATAIGSLRFVPGGAATTRLREALSDPETSVRMAACRSFLWRPFAARDVALFLARLGAEPEARVRAELYENLLLERSYHAGLDAAIVKALARETDTGLRAAVRGRLAGR